MVLKQLVMSALSQSTAYPGAVAAVPVVNNHEPTAGVQPAHREVSLLDKAAD